MNLVMTVQCIFGAEIATLKALSYFGGNWSLSNQRLARSTSKRKMHQQLCKLAAKANQTKHVLIVETR